MSQDENIQFLPYEEAVRIVAAIQEEEDIHRPDHRILTVYNHNDKERKGKLLQVIGPEGPFPYRNRSGRTLSAFPSHTTEK